VVSEMKLGKAIVGTQHTAEHTWPSSPACDPLFFSPAVSRDPDSSGSFFKILTNRQCYAGISLEVFREFYYFENLFLL